MAITQLDPSQKHVLRSIMSSDTSDITVVHGPPGTGKSQLLVNLLFELASANKSVLFVSQNTEALDVIDRKIADVERSLNLSDDALTFKDFILKLYTREHRTLKYISRQYSRLQSRNVPSYDRSALEQTVEQLHYPLSYTKLEKYENEHPTSPGIGVDELLGYYLKSVKTQMVGSNVRNLSLIDVRAVMAYLDAFKDEYKTFSTYNHPQNALRFVSKTNTNITLGTLRAHGSNVENAYGLVDSSVVNVKSIRQTEIKSFIDSLNLYCEYSGLLDLHKLQSSSISVSTLIGALKDVVLKSDVVLADVDKLVGVEGVREKVFNDTKFHKYLANSELASFTSDVSKLISVVDKLTEQIPTTEDSSVLELTDDALVLIDLDVSPLVRIIPELESINADGIKDLITILEKWNNQNSFMRAVKKKPEGIDKYFKDIDKVQLENLNENIGILETLAEVLIGTPVNIGLYDKLFQRAKAKSIAFNQLNGTDIETTVSILNLSLVSNIILQKYEIDRSISLADIKRLFRGLIDDIDYLRVVVSQNRRLHHKEGMEIVELINNNILSNSAVDYISKTMEEYAVYFGARSQDEYIEKARSLLISSENVGEVINNIITTIDVPTSPLTNSEGLRNLSDLIRHGASENLFGHYYHTIEQGMSTKNWYDNISSLMSYNSTKELDGFIQQHKFLQDLRTMLGENSEWVDDRIADESIDYERFHERIVNDLVRASIDSMNFAERKSVESSFFDQYHQQLSARRKAYYIAGLKNIFTYYSMEGARRISNTNNWVSASSPMDKIRANTRLIKDTYPVVLATPKEVAKYLEPTAEMFDFVLFDEASQLLPGQAIPSIYRAKKAVIVGDPHQMPPSLTTGFGTVEAEPDDDGFEELGDSILDLAISLQNTTAQHHLKVHYRSESNKLFEPSRSAIYGKDGIQPIVEAITLEKTPISIEDNLGENDVENFKFIVERISSRLKREADATFCILFTRLDVLSLFKDYLAEHESEFKNVAALYEDNRILISTVTNCQGIEGDYTIMYLNSYTSVRGMWFFKEQGGAYKRLNVAITRQRKNLDILMANPRSLWLSACEQIISGRNSQPNTRKSAELLQSLLRNAGEAVDEAYLDRTLSKNELSIDSPLTEQLYKMLQEHYKTELGSTVKLYCEVGWQLLIPNEDNILEHRRNVGFRLDIGVYSTEAQSFVLGIEMDGAAYHSGYDKEHSDYLREQVLKSKGWDVYRIWSTNWLNDTKGEFEKLTRHIDHQLKTALKNEQYSAPKLDIKSNRETEMGELISTSPTDYQTQVKIIDLE